MSHKDKQTENPSFATYNVRVYFPGPEHMAWCNSHNMHAKLFVNYDGGGYNFNIFEFIKIEDAKEFMLQFDISGEHMLWAEDTQGNIHYL